MIEVMLPVKRRAVILLSAGWRFEVAYDLALESHGRHERQPHGLGVNHLLSATFLAEPHRQGTGEGGVEERDVRVSVLAVV